LSEGGDFCDEVRGQRQRQKQGQRQKLQQISPLRRQNAPPSVEMTILAVLESFLERFAGTINGFVLERLAGLLAIGLF
jgi:hypothetical protein